MLIWYDNKLFQVFEVVPVHTLTSRVPTNRSYISTAIDLSQTRQFFYEIFDVFVL